MAMFSVFVGRHVCPWLPDASTICCLTIACAFNRNFCSSHDLAQKIVNKTSREHDLTRVDVLRERHVELKRIVFGKDEDSEDI